MDAPIRDIPGYYYDKEKKRYFKAQKHSPDGTAYSSQDVKRRRARDEKDRQKADAQAYQHGRIRSSRILKTPLAGQIFSRELGANSHHEFEAAQIYSQGLAPQGRLGNLLAESSGPIFVVEARNDLGPSVADIRIALNDQLFGVCVATTNHANEAINVPHNSQAAGPVINSSCGVRTLTPWRIQRFGNPGQSTSLNIHEPTRRVAMTWLSGSSNSGIVVAPMDDIHPNAETESPSIILGPGVDRGREPNIFSSTPAPLASSFAFAFGSSYGILAIKKEDFSLGWVRPQSKGCTDTLALEFMADNHHILLSGCRKGLLNVTDLRVPGASKEDLIHHPSTITHIQQLDSHRIIVAGLSSSLCQYDLRFRKTTTTLHPRNSTQRKYITKPVLNYPDFKNDSIIRMAFDVDLETGIVAAGQETDGLGSPLQLFSLHGGHEVTPPQIPHDFTIRNNVSCVKFARDIYGRMKSLYVGSASNIQRFAWAEAEDSF